MSDERSREARLADEFEAIATQLRDGEATLYSYHVEIDGDRTSERGGVAYEGGWIRFDIEQRP